MMHSYSGAAEWLGIGKTLLFEEVANGRILPVRIGRRVLFPTASLEDYEQLLVEEALAEGKGRL
jgi:excisionase family DNA binding protein